MMGNREKLIEVFNDTSKTIKNKYQQAVTDSIQKSVIYFESTADINKLSKPHYFSEVIINRRRSFEAAEDILSVCPDKKVAVLNFASAKNPGGYVTGGSSAQEESLCRVSTLYHVISNDRFKKDFYTFHKNKHDNNFYTDRLIYSPNIKIIKDDDFNYLSKPVTVDVITCAAPNLNAHSKDGVNGTINISREDLFNMHYNRCTNMLRAAADQDVDILILGAFGCGVFKNDPVVVASAMKQAIEDCPYKFYKIIFPIYCKEWEKQNYKAFMDVFVFGAI